MLFTVDLRKEADRQFEVYVKLRGIGLLLGAIFRYDCTDPIDAIEYPAGWAQQSNP